MPPPPRHFQLALLQILEKLNAAASAPPAATSRASLSRSGTTRGARVTRRPNLFFLPRIASMDPKRQVLFVFIRVIAGEAPLAIPSLVSPTD